MLKNESAENITLESIVAVLEAPAEVTPDGDDESPMNYDDEMVADDEEDTPNDYSGDMDDDTTDDDIDDSTDDSTSDDNTDDDTSSIDDETPNDYSDDLTMDDTDDESTDDTDDTSDESTTDETVDDNIQMGNNRIKNYNLMLQFQKMYKTTEDLIQHLKTVYF